MANATSDHLFDLIKSLSKTEKRFFKLYASRHNSREDNNALLIFDYLAKMESYDESRVFKKFKDKAFLNNFSITKHRLYQQVLDSLVQYNAKASLEIELINGLQGASILFSKGLYSQAKKSADSILKKAQNSALLFVQWQALQLLKQIHEQQFYTQLSDHDGAIMVKDEALILDSLKNKNQLWFIKASLFKKIHAVGTVRSAEQENALKDIIAPLESISIDDDVVENQYLYHQILGAYFFTVQSNYKCYEQLLKIRGLFASNAELFSKKDGKYLSLLTNLVYIAIKLNKHAVVADCLKEIELDKAHYQKTQDLQVKYFSSYYSMKLFSLIEMGEVIEESVLEATESGLIDYSDNINIVRKAYFHFQLGVYYLGLSKYKKALQHINSILNEKQSLVKEDIYSFAQIILLIIHFELKNHRFLSFALNSTKRFLKNKNRLNAFERIFLKIIGKIKSGQINDIELQDILLEFQPAVKNLKSDKYEKNAFDYFDFDVWIDSKLLKKPYLEIKKASA